MRGAAAGAEVSSARRVRLVLAHDYLTQRGGAERVVLELARQFPYAPVLTSFYEPESTFSGFADVDVRPSSLSRLRFLRVDPRRALPLLALLFSSRRAPGDVLLASSSGWAHALRSSGPKVVYCHNPARWLYQPDDYFAALPPAARRVLAVTMAPLRAWDRRAARTATAYVANSTSVAERIRSAYGIAARVVFPPGGLAPDGAREPVPGVEPGFLLTVGRRRGYKNTELVCQAAERAGCRLVVVGGLPERDLPWPGHIVGVRDISDASLRWLYASCGAVVAMSHEDFGLTPVEGFAFGKPCIALRAGGYLDSCVEGLTGPFVDAPTTAALAAAFAAFDAGDYDPDRIRHHARRFTPQAFGDQVLAVLEEATGESLRHERAGGSSEPPAA